MKYTHGVLCLKKMKCAQKFHYEHAYFYSIRVLFLRTCMKFISSQLSIFLQTRGAKRNMFFLLRFIMLLIFLIAAYSIIFHYIMQFEGRSFSWTTGVYWTLTVMSTLGFGDITFTSDMGRFFSIVVLMSGVILLLVMLPFTFIQYFYAPWLEAQKKRSTPRKVPANTNNHVVFVGITPLTLNTVDELERYGTQCVLLCNDSQATLDLIDQGYETIMGDHDDGSVYKNLCLQKAAMLVALDGDMRNTNITFTARDIAPNVPITTAVQSDEAIDILELAGATHVIQFHKLLGTALARRVLDAKSPTSIISEYGKLVIAEAPAMRTSLIGQSLMDCGLKTNTGVNVVGLWESGKFIQAHPNTIFTDASVLVMAGTHEQMKLVDSFLAKPAPQEETPIVILGCGRVGISAAQYLESVGRSYRFVEKKSRIGEKIPKKHIIVGDAADIDTLEEAGIRSCPSIIITTHDDDTNIYLTLYCRRLRPGVQIISRANLDRNIGILHAAGADLVLSLASMMTSSIVNLLAPGKVFMLNEGLKIFRCKIGAKLQGQSLIDSGIRSLTGCNVVALQDKNGDMQVNPDPDHIFSKKEEMYLIGDSQAEQAFNDTFGCKESLIEEQEVNK